MNPARPVLLFLAAVVLFPLSSFAGPCGDFIHRPDEPGKVKVKVEKGGYEKYYRLTKAEDAAFNAHLKKILDIILEQPHLKPPRGTELRGWLRNWRVPACPEGGGTCRGVPVAGQGVLHFHRLLEGKGGKVFPIIEADGGMSFSINDLDQALGFDFFGTDSQGRKIRAMLEFHGDINGAALFRYGWGSELVVIARGDRHWWEPVSREEFLKARIRDIEKEVAKVGKISGTPHGDLYQKWLAEKPKRQKEADDFYREMKKTNPALAESLREQGRKLEAEMTEKFRQESERESAKPPQKWKNPNEDSLRLHREALEAMPPAERAAPAYHLRKENPLEAGARARWFNRGRAVGRHQPGIFRQIAPPHGHPDHGGPLVGGLGEGPQLAEHLRRAGPVNTAPARDRGQNELGLGQVGDGEVNNAQI